MCTNHFVCLHVSESERRTAHSIIPFTCSMPPQNFFLRVVIAISAHHALFAGYIEFIAAFGKLM